MQKLPGSPASEEEGNDMTSTADRAISALRTGHESLTALLGNLSPAELVGPSGASEWTIAQVLSHLGSGAEIGLANLDASLDGGPAPDSDFNNGVWDRWNAMDPQEQAESFVKSNERLVERYESLDQFTRDNQQIIISFLPEPVDVATSAAFRLNEFTLHTWDVAVAVDPQATLAPEALEHVPAALGTLFGWIAKPGPVLDGREVSLAVTTAAPDNQFGLTLSDQAALTVTPARPDATLTLPTESWLRLISGRLAPAHTPESVTVTGAITLDELRKIFPGY
jgi:uncharacterized protein (TIGR03083 family)